MAPQLTSLEKYSDVQFRDVIHRRSSQVAPSANVIQKLYTHLNGSTPVLSGAEAITTDGDDNNAQYSIFLSSNASPLNANTITASNIATLSVMSLTKGNAIIRSTLLTANAITCNTLSIANDVTFNNVAVGGAMTLTGSNNTFDSMATVTVSRTISGSTVGSGVEIGYIGMSGFTYGTGMVEIQLSTSANDLNNAVSKSFRIPFHALISYSTRRVLPLSSIGADNDVGIDAINQDNTLFLRLVRLSVDGAIDTSTVFQVGLIIHHNKSSGFTLANGWTPQSGAYTSPLPATIDKANICPGTIMTQGINTIGIMTDKPQAQLDVSGTARIRENFYVGNSLDDTTAGIYGLGTNHQIDCHKIFSANVRITNSALYAGTKVASVSFDRSCVLDISLTMFADPNNSVSKAYTVPLQKDVNLNELNWVRLLPTTSSIIATTFATNDIDLDVQTSASGILNIAVVRSTWSAQAVSSAPISVTITARYNKYAGACTISPLSGMYTGYSIIAAANIFSSCAMTTSGQLGVGVFVEPKNSPYFFDVDAPGNASSNFRTGLNIDRTKPDKCYLSFGNTWRLYLNPTTQDLEIHKNNDPNDTTWSGNVVTAILATM